MNAVFVDSRVQKRHPELSESDVLEAWNNCIRSRPRLHKNPDEYIAIGIDGKGRQVELVAIRGTDGDWLIYHAFTPPTKNFKRELGERR